MATKAQKAYALNTYFAKQYLKYMKMEHRGNTHRDKWGFQSMIDDLGEDRAKAAIDWFFNTQRDDYTPQNLFNNYDKIAEAMDDFEEEKRHLADLLELTRKKVEEARRQRGLN